MHSFRHFFLAALLGPFFIATAHAVTLDWDTVTWTAGSLRDPAWTGFGSCLVAAALILRHSAKFRK